MLHATMWINCGNTMLNERSQSQKTVHIVQFHLYEISRIGKAIEIESRLICSCLSPGDMRGLGVDG